MLNKESKKKTKRVVRYRLGYSASDIKDKILRFMTTFNPSSEPVFINHIEGQILELRDDHNEIGNRERAYS